MQREKALAAEFVAGRLLIERPVSLNEEAIERFIKREFEDWLRIRMLGAVNAR